VLAALLLSLAPVAVIVLVLAKLASIRSVRDSEQMRYEPDLRLQPLQL
jgi:hypothetical protein